MVVVSPRVTDPARLWGGAATKKDDEKEDAGTTRTRKTAHSSPRSISASMPKKRSHVAATNGKVGGMPVWLDPAHPLEREQVVCGVCRGGEDGETMRFLLQINAPAPDQPDAYRTLYVFACHRGACLLTDSSRSCVVARSIDLTSQRPRRALAAARGERALPLRRRGRQGRDDRPGVRRRAGSETLRALRSRWRSRLRLYCLALLLDVRPDALDDADDAGAAATSPLQLSRRSAAPPRPRSPTALVSPPAPSCARLAASSAGPRAASMSNPSPIASPPARL